MGRCFQVGLAAEVSSFSKKGVELLRLQLDSQRNPLQYGVVREFPVRRAMRFVTDGWVRPMSFAAPVRVFDRATARKALMFLSIWYSNKE